MLIAAKREVERDFRGETEGSRQEEIKLKSLILAQMTVADALHMQVERQRGLRSGRSGERVSNGYRECASTGDNCESVANPDTLRGKSRGCKTLHYWSGDIDVASCGVRPKAIDVAG
ncbi:hypothetical protein FQR65_LT20591 [Abscondita terminalis]|nr:hypothetical protein FQR65_LT20591 [Abscondita terminalis]